MTPNKPFLPIPSSLRDLHGRVDLDWYLALIPVLLHLQANHPEGWRAAQLIKTAIELGAHEHGTEIFPSKAARTLEAFERFGYVQKNGELYTVNVEQIRFEIELAMADYQRQISLGLGLGETLKSAAALGPAAARTSGKSKNKGFIARVKSILTS